MNWQYLDSTKNIYDKSCEYVPTKKGSCFAFIMGRFASMVYIYFVVCGAIPWLADKDFQKRIYTYNMLGKQMCMCLHFSQTAGCFETKKNPYWQHTIHSSRYCQLFCFTLTAEPYQWISAEKHQLCPTSSSIHEPPDTSASIWQGFIWQGSSTLTQFVQLWRSYLPDLVAVCRFYLPDTVTQTMTHYLLIPPAAAGATVRHHQIYLNSAVSKRQVLQIRTVNAVQDPAVTEHFLLPGSYILWFCAITRYSKDS